MYRYTKKLHTTVEDFEFPVGFHLDENNRWVVLANIIPWENFEKEYAVIFDEKIGAPAKAFQIALASLIIQQTLNLTDRETVEQIKENPYLQYFLGLSRYQYKAPFESSMLVHFRKRINSKIINKINKTIVKSALKEPEKKENNEKGKKKSYQTAIEIYREKFRSYRRVNKKRK